MNSVSDLRPDANIQLQLHIAYHNQLSAGSAHLDRDMFSLMWGPTVAAVSVVLSEASSLTHSISTFFWSCSEVQGACCYAGSAHLDRDMFSLMWGPTVAAVSVVLDHAEDMGTVRQALDGLLQAAKLGAYHHVDEVSVNSFQQFSWTPPVGLVKDKQHCQFLLLTVNTFLDCSSWTFPACYYNGCGQVNSCFQLLLRLPTAAIEFQLLSPSSETAILGLHCSS